MPFTNFPQGFASGLSVRGVPLLQTHPGQTFYVGNSTVLNPSQRGGSDGSRGTFLDPLATLDAAVSGCVANRGDIIFVMPGHTETYSAASALALDVAGVAIIGLGAGSSRPTFTCDTVNTTPIVVSADNVSIQNCIFTANFLTIAACFTVTTAKNFSVDRCMFTDTGAALNFANAIKSTGGANTADGLSMTNCSYPSAGTTFNTAVLIANAVDGLVLDNNDVYAISTSDVATLGVSTTGAVTNARIANNRTRCKATSHASSLLFLGTGSASSGIVQNNFCASLDASAGVLVIVTLGFFCQGNSITGAYAGQGFPIPALDS